MVAKVTPAEKICPTCKTVFLVGGTGRRKRGTVFCSNECRVKGPRIIRSRRTPCASTLSDLEASYLAGMMDADGHIGLYRKGGKYRESVTVTIEVTNTFEPLLEWIKAQTGVGNYYNQFKGSEVRKPTYYWTVSGFQAVDVLMQVLPYLRVKSERARLALLFWNERLTNTSDDVSWQSNYFDKMKKLNKRGPKTERYLTA